jgi:hypothetical protein
MKYIKKFENIDWNWVDEEESYFSIIDIDINKLNKDEYEQLLKNLKVGDRYIFEFYVNGQYYNNKKGEIKYLGGRYNIIGIEFDEVIVHGHNGSGFYIGTPGHCWNFLLGKPLVIKEKLN